MLADHWDMCTVDLKTDSLYNTAQHADKLVSILCLGHTFLPNITQHSERLFQSLAVRVSIEQGNFRARWRMRGGEQDAVMKLKKNQFWSIDTNFLF